MLGAFVKYLCKIRQSLHGILRKNGTGVLFYVSFDLFAVAAAAEFIYHSRLERQPLVSVNFGKDQGKRTLGERISRAAFAETARVKDAAKRDHRLYRVKNADRRVVFLYSARKSDARDEHLATAAPRGKDLNEQPPAFDIESAIIVRHLKNGLEPAPQRTLAVAFDIVFFHIFCAQHYLELRIAYKNKFHINLAKISLHYNYNLFCDEM